MLKGNRYWVRPLLTLSLTLPALLIACSGDDDDVPLDPIPGGAAGEGGSGPGVVAGATNGGEAAGTGGAGGQPGGTGGVGGVPASGAAGGGAGPAEGGAGGDAGAAGAGGEPSWEPGSPLIVPPGADVASKSQSQLAADWWAWINGAPASTNPLLDETGEHCAVNQPTGVFFLAGNFGGTSVRSCTVPAATPIFFPLLNAETDNCNIEVASQQSAEEQQAFIDATMSSAVDFEVEIDGELIVDGLEDGLHYAVGQKQFSYEVPVNDSLAHYFFVNYGSPYTEFSGTCTPAQSDGYYVGLQGLTAGEHLLRFRSKSSDGFSVNVIYQLTVSPP